MRNNNRLFLTLSALLALGLAGCGGGGGSDPVLAANAGPDKTVNEGDAVTLEGSGSTSNADATMTFAWRQIGGAIVDLESNPSSATLMFNAPTTFDPTTQHSGRTLTFELIVSDGNASATDSVSVNVTDVTAPTVTVLPEGGILGKSEKIRIQFNEFVDQDSLVLTGTLADEAEITWFSDAPVLGLSPKTADGEWTSGSNRSLSIAVSDAAGNKAVADVDFLVKLVFENFQAADVVIGQPDMDTANAELDENSFGGEVYGRAWVDNGKLYASDKFQNRIMGFNTIPDTNGASADFVIGQDNFTSTGTGTSATDLNNPSAVTVHDGKLVVTEISNNRVSIYSPLPTADANSAPGTISVVAGQADFTSQVSGCVANRLDGLEDSIVTPDGKLIVADSGNDRVLIWNSLPAGNNQPADMVLGRPAFDTCGGTVPAADTMDYPSGVWSDGEKLVVIDYRNNRALIWNSFPTSNGQPADLVLGQADFTKSSSDDSSGDGTSNGVAANTFDEPFKGVTSNGEQLFIADTENHRVLIWNSWPTANHQPADTVLGQKDFSLETSNNDDGDDGTASAVPSARTLNYPSGLYLHGSQLIVTDATNSRYLIYNSK